MNNFSINITHAIFETFSYKNYLLFIGNSNSTGDLVFYQMIILRVDFNYL